MFGELEWLGGLELWSTNRHFGALSGLVVEEDGAGFTAVTDNGFWVQGTIDQDAEARPLSLSDVQIAPMLNADGKVMNLKESADAESLTSAVIDGKPVFLAAFERVHRILVYDRSAPMTQGRPTVMPLPQAARRLRANKGIESIAVVPEGVSNAGSVLVIAERSQRSGGNIPAWMIAPNGRSFQFEVRRRDNYDITDAVFLPDGTLILLERRFSFSEGIYMRMRRIPNDRLKARAIADGRLLMEADFTHQIDNMEGLAFHYSQAGDVIFTLVSDDNRSILQRTLLLRFRLRNPLAEVRPQPRPASSSE